MNLIKSKTTGKVVAGLLGLALVFTFVMAFAVTVTADTGYTFSTNMTVGSRGVDVMNLQKVLNSSADTQVALTGAGSPGSETSFFGQATKKAVMKFQSKFGISPVAGYVGALTRAKLNSMATTGGPVTPPVVTPGLPTGGNLTVTAGTQPMNSLAPQNAARIPFTTVILTAGSADVTVNSITVQRVGLAQDSIFSGVTLVDSNNVQIGTSKTFNSNHQANVGEPFVIKAGTSMTVTVAGNMLTTSLTNYAGQVVGLDVVAVNTSATVAGSMPIHGAQHTVNASLSIGSVSTSTSAFDPGAAQTKNIGDTGVRVSGVKFTANSTEDLKLFSIRWRQTGTASASDISNVVTIVNGTSYPTTVSADGKYYTSVFPGGILIPKGNSVDVYSQVDITGSNSNLRTVDLDIDKVTDVYFVGQTYGYGVAPSGTYTPWYDSKITTINAGTVTTIGKANEVPAQNITTNVNNQVLGGFATNFAGEPVSISGMTLTLSTSTAGLGGVVTSVSIVDSNGTVVAGPVDAVYSGAGGAQVATFTDTVTFPVGRKVYTIKGKIPSAATNGAVITASLTPSGWTNPTGQVTGSTVSLAGNGAFNMNVVTVKGAALAINLSAQPSAQSVVGGATGLVLANYQLDASQSGEDVRLNAMPVQIDFITNPTVADLTGCVLSDGTTPLNTGSRTVNTLTDNTKVVFSFDNSLIIPKGTVKVLSLACNLVSSPVSTSYQVNADQTTTDYSITGVTSGSAVTPTFGGATTGGLMTAASGSLSASIDASSPGYALAAGGTTGQTMSVIKLRATNENVNLNKIGLVLTTVTTGNSSNVAGDLTQVYLYQGSNLIGTAIFASGNTVATSTLSTPLVLTKDTDTLITVKADLADVGTSQSGVEGDLIKVDLSSTEGSGASSGGTVRTGAATGAAGVRLFNTFPVVSLDTLSQTGIADGRLMRFKVTADSHGDVGIYKFTFTLATSTVTVRDIGLFGYSDSSYSTPAGGNFFSTNGSSGQVDENVATSSATGICTGNGSNTVNTTLAGSTCYSDSTKTTLAIRASTNPVEIPAGATRYFELRGSVSGISTTGSVVTKMIADTAISTSTATGVGAGTTYNFVWSPNATSTSVFSSNDWTSGYGIVGLPSAGILQSRSI